jgi:deoxyribodipyrimidine photo-lyase
MGWQMAKEYQLTAFLFHRDLRLDDNTGLLYALEKSERVIPCFIFDPAQVGPKNKYGSTNAIQFMIESLQDLQNQLKKHHGRLYLFY